VGCCRVAVGIGLEFEIGESALREELFLFVCEMLYIWVRSPGDNDVEGRVVAFVDLSAFGLAVAVFVDFEDGGVLEYTAIGAVGCVPVEVT
jgi:hypothetical protein